MKRIGIFGGTFNPVHIGHLIIAQEACRKLKLDKVFFVPSYSPPHKSGQALIDAEHRYKMVHLAIKDNPCFALSASEIHRKGTSYSIETIREFRTLFGAATRIFFIIGADTVAELNTWYEIAALRKLVTFVVATRPGYRISTKRTDYELIDVAVDVSSSMIRRLAKKGGSLRYVVPEGVRIYIIKNKLYRY